jgi:transposase-like protein
MMGKTNVFVAGVAVVATCAALGFGYAWWSLKQAQEGDRDASQEIGVQMKRQMAKLKGDMEAMEQQRVELDAQLKELPDLRELQSQIEAVQAKTRELPNTRELRREAVGIQPDGSHASTGRIPPTVLHRMNEELGLSPQELRKLNGE